MRVLILAVNFQQTPYPVYPLGASAAAAAAMRHGHEALLCDLLAEGGFGEYDPSVLFRAVDSFRPECVGISVRNIESTDSLSPFPESGIALVKRIVADLGTRSAAPVVLGGPGFSLLPEILLARSGAEYGVAGEAEEAFPAFLEALADGRAPKGLWPANGRMPMAVPGGGLYQRNLTAAYAKQGGLVGVQTKRGCPLRCVYCSYPLLEGRRIRARPMNEVMADIRRIADAVEQPYIAFADAVFNDGAGHWRTLLRAIAESDVSIAWTAFFQPYGFEKGDIDLIRASGAAGLEFGTDAASDACLRGLGKPFDFATARETQRVCADAGLPAAHYIIFGGPGETPETVEEGIANLESLEKCVALISTGLSVYPGTPLHRLALAEGAVAADEDFREPVGYYSPRIEPEQLAARLREAFARRRDRIFPLSAADEKAAVLRRMGFRGLLWDTLIRR